MAYLFDLRENNAESEVGRVSGSGRVELIVGEVKPDEVNWAWRFGDGDGVCDVGESIMSDFNSQ